jgi:C-terminal processing protease CtpA/Prc
VVEGTPAFNADVLAGDILLQIADDRVAPQNYQGLISKYQGQRVVLRLERAGREIVKDVTLNRE